MKKLLACLIAFTIYNSSFAQELLKDAMVGYAVVDVKSGTTICESNGNVALVPASVAKLITTASALEILSPQKRFETKVEYNGKIIDGTLCGKLIVKGCGDPTLGSSYMKSSKEIVFNEIISIMNNNGIRELCGEIVCDNSAFPFNGARGYWLAEDLGNYFAAESYGFNFMDNSYTLFFNTSQKGSKAEIVDCVPAMPELEFINKLEVEGNGKDSAYISGSDFCNTKLLSGRVPCNRTKYKLKGAVPSPSNMFIREFKKYLKERNMLCDDCEVELSGKNIYLGSLHSPTLNDIVRVTNHRSNNLYAETILKWCATGKGKEATTANGIEVINMLWREKGIDISNCKLFDGSGLSPKNRVSANSLAYLLWAVSDNISFRKSIPKVGEEGTVKNFMASSPIAKYLSLKTGSMQGVQCYAGYYDNGEECYAIVVIVNNFSGKRRDVQNETGRLIEKIITKI